ncbi:MAG: ATP-binding cassette domain-containing protein [Acidobacteriia bacterium]|nr:ATP-binding cassette domain-containing protein [Terriglobia bacterium]
MPVPLIHFENVSVHRGNQVILHNVNLSIAQGEHVAILGPNGSGKSTLIKVISRELYPLLQPEPWSLEILGRDRWNLFELRNHLGIVSNDWIAMCTRDYSGYEIVLSGFFGSVGIWPNHTVTPEMEQKVREVMEVLEISHLAERNTEEMSSGEARRILIARALVHDPRALVLDEPTNSLDLRAHWELRGILRKLAQNGISLILVTHHLPDIIPEMRRVILIRQGRVFCDGPKEQVLRAEALSGLFGIELEVIERGGYYYVL